MKFFSMNWQIKNSSITCTDIMNRNWEMETFYWCFNNVSHVILSSLYTYLFVSCSLFSCGLLRTHPKLSSYIHQTPVISIYMLEEMDTVINQIYFYLQTIKRKITFKMPSICLKILKHMRNHCLLKMWQSRI